MDEHMDSGNVTITVTEITVKIVADGLYCR